MYSYRNKHNRCKCSYASTKPNNQHSLGLPLPFSVLFLFDFFLTFTLSSPLLSCPPLSPVLSSPPLPSLLLSSSPLASPTPLLSSPLLSSPLPLLSSSPLLCLPPLLSL